MASKTAILSVRIISDAKKAVAGFNAALSGVDKLEKGLGKVAPAALAASGAVIAMGKQALDSASALQQSTGAVESVFKGQADSVKALAAEAANAVGLSANQYQEFASVMGSQLKNLGIAQSDLVPTTDKLITMGADLASMYGGTTAEAVEALSAAFRGETDPIERYGITIRKADINARMAKDGLSGLEGEALKQAEAQTLLKMLTEQSADAMGNFARETDTAAGSAQIAAANWENAKAALGQSLLPIATAVAQKMAEIAQKVAEHPAVFTAMAAGILTATAAITGMLAAIKAYRSVVAILAAVKSAWAAWQASALLANIQFAGFAVRYAASVAAAWVASAARSTAAWVATTARMAAAWVAAGARAVASAAMAAAAWVASAARTIGALAMQAAAFVAQNAAILAARGATLAAAAAQWVLNAALAANPIGLVVAAVAALIAVLVVVYQRCEAFRNIVNAVRNVATVAFTMIAAKVRAVISTVASLIARAGGIGGIFRSVMSVAASAVGVLMSPLNALIGLISRVIGAISSIRFPSPPGWMQKFMAAPAPSLVMSAPGSIHAAGPATMSGGGILRAAGGAAVVQVDNSVHINVDGSGIWEPRAVAAQIRDVLKTDGRARGSILAAGGGVI